MALGDFSMFSFKSKAEREREQEEYAEWAFPYGQKQRDNLEPLLRSLFPKASLPMCLIPFLTCKELYQGSLKKTGSPEAASYDMINIQRDYKKIIKKKEMPIFLALVLADAKVDERCEYPTADEIRVHTQRLESLRGGR